MPLSGVDDMATLVGFVWQRLADWFTEGPPQAPPPHQLAAQKAMEDGQDDTRMQRLFGVVARYSGAAASGVKAAALQSGDASAGGRGSGRPVVARGRDVASGSRDGDRLPAPVFLGLGSGDAAVESAAYGILAAVWDELLPAPSRLLGDPAAPTPAGSVSSVPHMAADGQSGAHMAADGQSGAHSRGDPQPSASLPGKHSLEYHGHAVRIARGCPRAARDWICSWSPCVCFLPGIGSWCA